MDNLRSGRAYTIEACGLKAQSAAYGRDPEFAALPLAEADIPVRRDQHNAISEAAGFWK
jgi:hypothetical protein